jgi:hypothetical protein
MPQFRVVLVLLIVDSIFKYIIIKEYYVLYSDWEQGIEENI